MKVESFIESHQDHCDDDPIHLLNASSLSTLPESVTPTGLSYDHRVKLFTELSKSLLFKHHDVKIADLKYWFPEYVQSPKKEHATPIPKPVIEESIECVIAEMMDGDPSVFL